jgi:hypothetical protein
MPAGVVTAVGPGLLESAGSILGIAGLSFAAFTVVSFLEVRNKYQGDDWAPYQPPAPPPPQKSATLAEPPPSKKTSRGFGKR